MFKASSGGNAHQIVRIVGTQVILPFPLPDIDIQHALMFNVCAKCEVISKYTMSHQESNEDMLKQEIEVAYRL